VTIRSAIDAVSTLLAADPKTGSQVVRERVGHSVQSG
jgi:hypothetical protein